MKSDTRDKNLYFDHASYERYIREYAAKIGELLGQIDFKSLNNLADLIDQTRAARKSIWTMGNGGSLAIAEHLCCDWSKGLNLSQHTPVKVHPLTSGPLLTAISNDISYSDAFSEQVKMFCEPGDVVLVISSSGDSENVVRAVEVAKSLGAKTVAFTGFEGGRLRKLADVNIHIPFSNYGVVEDAHQIVMHVIAQVSYLKKR